jgi:trigger factor
MNVTRHDVDALNSVLKVKIEQADYQDKVRTSLEKYRKTAKIPGFRPGHVPFALIQKQYGKSVLADELNRLVNEALYKFIEDNKIDILGNPIPKSDSDVAGSFDKPDSFEFEYEIGLSPKFEIPLSTKSKYDYLKVRVDEDLINKQIEDLTRRYGKLVSAESVGEKDLVMAQFVELNEDGTIKESGILHSSTVSMEFIEDKSAKMELLGKHIGDKITVDPTKVSRGGKDTAAMLGISEEELGNISSKFQLTINEIKHMEAAALDQELFVKLFGQGVVNSEKELRERVESDLKGMFSNDSDRMLTRTIFNDLIEKTKVDLPDQFLKRWIKLSNQKEITEEQIDKDYDGYAKGLRWQLIQGTIFKENAIGLEQQEVIDFTKGLVVSNYAQYGIPAPEDEQLTATAMSVLKNKEETNRIYDMLAEQKLTKYFKETVQLIDKPVSYDEFMDVASKQ